MPENEEHKSTNDFPGLVRAQISMRTSFRCTDAKRLGGNVTMRGKYRSFEEAERIESRRDAIRLVGGLVATAIVLAMIVVGIVVAQ